MSMFSEKARQGITVAALALSISLTPTTSKAIGDDLGTAAAIIVAGTGGATILNSLLNTPEPKAYYEGEIARQMNMGSRISSTTQITLSAFSESDPLMEITKRFRMGKSEKSVREMAQQLFDAAGPLSLEKWRALRGSAVQFSGSHNSTHFQILTDAEAFDGVGSLATPLRPIKELDEAILELSNSSVRAASVRMVSITPSLGTVDDAIGNISKAVRSATEAAGVRSFNRVIMASGGVMVLTSAAYVVFSK